jgi:hypothetical protein
MLPAGSQSPLPEFRTVPRGTEKYTRRCSKRPSKAHPFEDTKEDIQFQLSCIFFILNDGNPWGGGSQLESVTYASHPPERASVVTFCRNFSLENSVEFCSLSGNVQEKRRYCAAPAAFRYDISAA